MKEKTIVMVTGVGGGGHGEQILKALRLAETPYEIVGCDMSPYSTGLKIVDHPYVVPPARDPRYLEVLLKICKKHGVKALFHGSEPELLVMSRNRPVFEKEKIFLPINPVSVIETCMRKASTFRFLDEHGFLYPQTRIFSGISDLEDWNYFPAVLKPSIGSGGSANSFIVQNREELEMLVPYLLELKIASELIIQEYEGRPESEFTVGVLFDMDGNLINSIAVRRNLSSSLSCRMRLPNRTGRDELGPYLSLSTGISQGDIGPFPEVTAYCEEVTKALGACGTINVQCRLHEGKVYIFEINPRFSGTTSLRAMVGYNEPDILIRKHILGENIPFRFPYKKGVIVRSLDEHLFEEDKFVNIPKGADL